jgi:hypothetical protein
MLASYHFDNPVYVTLSKSPRAACFGIASLRAHSEFSAAFSCVQALFFYPLTWPTQLPGFPASPQRVGKRSILTSEKSDEKPFLLLINMAIEDRSPSRARQEKVYSWDRRIVSNMSWFPISVICSGHLTHTALGLPGRHL